MATPVLSVRELIVEFPAAVVHPRAVDNVSFEVAPGEIVALVGESGSGKTLTAKAVLGLLPDTARATGSIDLAGQQVLGLDEKALRSVRGRRAAMVFQEPSTALNPVETVGWQIGEALRAHRKVKRADARRRAVELLELVGIAEPQKRVGYYPHQLSGGQKQRVVIALALANEPDLIIADEPTTALDVTVQAEILSLLHDLRDRLGRAVLIITHNMGVVADLADRVVVLRSGRVVETSPVLELFARPRADYTRELLAAVPRVPTTSDVDAEASGDDDSARSRPAKPGAAVKPCGSAEPRGAVRSCGSAEPRGIVKSPASAEPAGLAEASGAVRPVVDFRDVVVEYPGRLGRPAFTAVDGVTLSLAPGEVLGLVGESGSGKTTLGRVVVGLLRPKAGRAEVLGADLGKLSAGALREVRARIGLVFQDPATTLDPRRTVGDAVGEPLEVHGRARGREARAQVAALLESVQLPTSYADRRPAELSGGQRQRAGLARALALDPQLLVADEPTSALDVSVQAAVLRLFRDLQEQYGFACLFISHDLAVVDEVADRVAVLRHGRVVEVGPAADVLRRPSADYTRRLVDAIPVPDPAVQRARRVLAG
ncbi:peptide/nickel transport system ATP-binding protein [Parafrankia irregularis]|uniref:Peptide/nickel transport system ATP-binding protein n=1 Tax=Parafrankia irregularis TaxID=795642 RepID=A0A0S4QZ97_9ACTN|nr:MULTISPECIES: ABC transporter ATP-binding protein [Parafrankia]CUU60495.1 peptide/nickel transport system ATP-binding protein [Parafrankia irregularis]